MFLMLTLFLSILVSHLFKRNNFQYFFAANVCFPNVLLSTVAAAAAAAAAAVAAAAAAAAAAATATAAAAAAATAAADGASDFD